jgi:hypothetical protein
MNGYERRDERKIRNRSIIMSIYCTLSNLEYVVAGKYIDRLLDSWFKEIYR